MKIHNYCIDKISVPQKSEDGKCPQYLIINGLQCVLVSDYGEKCCYQPVASVGRRRKNRTPTPPPTPCIAPTIEAQPISVEVMGGIVVVSAFQLLASPVTGGVPPYSYALSKDDITYTPFNTNPNLVTLSYDCDDVGTQLVYLRVASFCPPFNTYSTVSTFIDVQPGDCP